MSPCQFSVDDHGVTITCTRGTAHPKPCECGRPAVALCDYPLEVTFGKSVRTCDAPLCRDHRVHTRPGLDYCIGHSLDVPASAL